MTDPVLQGAVPRPAGPPVPSISTLYYSYYNLLVLVEGWNRVWPV